MIRKSNKLRLQEYFFRHPTASLRVREIERETGLPLPSITRYLGELVVEGVLQKKTLGTTQFYAANRADASYTRKKLLNNLDALFEAKLLEHLVEHYHNAAIRLFGSYNRGEDTEGSDIDLYIQTPLPPIDLKLFEKRLGKTIHLITAADVRTIENKELANNILNGMPLHGYIEVFA